MYIVEPSSVFVPNVGLHCRHTLESNTDVDIALPWIR